MDIVGSMISLVGSFLLVVAFICLLAGIVHVIADSLWKKRYYDDCKKPELMSEELWSELHGDRQALMLTWALSAVCAAIGGALVMLGRAILKL